jgi:hypothetical protein
MNKSYWKALELQRDGMFVPQELTEELLDATAGDNSRSVLVLFSFEMLSVLHDRGYENVTLYFPNPKKYLTNIANKYGYKVIGEIEDMRFDICLANPPFSDGPKLLYTGFFQDMLEHCEEVVFVMPLSLESQAPKLKKLNALVKKHSSYISESVSEEHFKKVGVPNICVVAASKNIQNEVPEEVDCLESIALLYPQRDRIKIRTGSLTFDSKASKDLSGGSVEVIDKVLRTGATFKQVPVHMYEKSKSYFSSGFGVLLGRQPSKGALNVHVLTEKDTKWASNVVGIECKNKKQAEKLAEWLQSEEMRLAVLEMLTAKNTFGVSKEMLERLPTYEI